MVSALRDGDGLRACPDADSDAPEAVRDQCRCGRNIARRIRLRGSGLAKSALFRRRMAGRKIRTRINDIPQDARLDVRGGRGGALPRTLRIHPVARTITP